MNKKNVGSWAPDIRQSIVLANIDRIAAVIQEKTQRGERVLVLCIYAAFRELLASFLRKFYGWDVSTKQSSTSQVAQRWMLSIVRCWLFLCLYPMSMLQRFSVDTTFRNLFLPLIQLTCQVAVLTARQSRGSEAQQVIACFFRRFAWEWLFRPESRPWED